MLSPCGTSERERMSASALEPVHLPLGISEKSSLSFWIRGPLNSNSPKGKLMPRSALHLLECTIIPAYAVENHSFYFRLNISLYYHLLLAHCENSKNPSTSYQKG